MKQQLQKKMRTRKKTQITMILLTISFESYSRQNSPENFLMVACAQGCSYDEKEHSPGGVEPDSTLSTISQVAEAPRSSSNSKIGPSWSHPCEKRVPISSTELLLLLLLLLVLVVVLLLSWSSLLLEAGGGFLVH